MAATSMVVRDQTARRWSPGRGGDMDALEIVGGTRSIDQLCASLSDFRPQLEGCALVLARLPVPCGAELVAAMTAVQSLKLPAHVCLVIDRNLLERIVNQIRGVDRVGLLLDNVGADTPLANVAHEALEAVRFNTEFAARAAGHLRSRCVLDALLSLTGDIGLFTFGPAMREDECEGSSKQFDYVATTRHPL